MTKEELMVHYIVSIGDEYTSFSANWEKNGHPVGLWVKYDRNVSHQRAFSVLSMGVWEAMQDPDAFNIDANLWEDSPGRQPPPYAILKEEPDA